MGMKCVILAGGMGTRISEETGFRPKPMVEIGGKPILWHVMKIYSACGIHDFVICTGYRGYMIKEYFANYFLHMSDVTFHMEENRMEVHQRYAEPWRVTLIDTGENTMTGGRIQRIFPYVKNEKAFCLTYGDGLANVDIGRLVEFHKKHGRKVSLTAVRPPGRFGALEVAENGSVTRFTEKPRGDGGMINGGFFVLSPQALNGVAGDSSVWEREPLQELASCGEVRAFIHEGFWYAMDTQRDKNYLEQLWASGTAPWKNW